MLGEEGGALPLGRALSNKLPASNDGTFTFASALWSILLACREGARNRRKRNRTSVTLLLTEAMEIERGKQFGLGRGVQGLEGIQGELNVCEMDSGRYGGGFGGFYN